MNPTITLIKNAVTLAREDYVPNRRPITDDQRRAMFARGGGGGGGGTSAPSHRRAKRPLLADDPGPLPAPSIPRSTGYLLPAKDERILDPTLHPRDKPRRAIAIDPLTRQGNR